MIEIQVNGEARECADSLYLSDLIRELSLPAERIAIEHNQQVVRRVDWPNTILAAGDRIEIVHFVGGGSGSVSGPLIEMTLGSTNHTKRSLVCFSRCLVLFSGSPFLPAETTRKETRSLGFRFARV